VTGQRSNALRTL